MSDLLIPERRQIPVTIDKSHLITIGERLYAEKMSFIRELVNNAYDADATTVTVEIASDGIVITDNGSGMDVKNLRLPHSEAIFARPLFSIKNDGHSIMIGI